MTPADEKSYDGLLGDEALELPIGFIKMFLTLHDLVSAITHIFYKAITNIFLFLVNTFLVYVEIAYCLMKLI